MKTPEVVFCLLLLFISSLSYGQDEGVRKLAISGFYESEDLLSSGKEYHEKLFGDVHPYDPEGYLTRAIEKLEAGFVNESLVDIKEAIELYPEYGGAYYIQGLAYVELDSIELAKQSYRSALDHAPLLSEASANLASLLAEDDELDAARAVLERAIARTPAHGYLHYTLGIVELYDNHPARAVKRIQEAIARDSCNIDAHVLAMIVQIERGNLKQALLQAERAIPCDQEAQKLYVLKGLIQIFRGKFSQALGELDIAIENQSDSRYAKHLRSLVLIKKSEYKAAVQDIQTLLQDQYVERDSFAMGTLSENFAVALQYYQKEKGNLTEKAQKRLEKGICDFYMESYQGASSHFESALASTSSPCMSCHYFLGMSMEKNYQGEAAQEQYSRALDLEPEVFELYARRAHLLDQLGKWKLAVADYSKALKLRPEEYHLHKDRGRVHMQLGMFNIAVLDYNLFLEQQDSVDLEVLFNRAICNKELKYYDNAIKDLSELLEKGQKDIQAYYERAFCHYMNKAPEKSKVDLDSVLLTNSFYPTAHNLRGLILLEEGAYDGALYHFSQAISQRRGYQEACFNKYLAYRGLENYEGALHCMNELIGMDAENGLYYFHRGYVKKQLGNTTACDDVDKAVALGLTIEQEARELICSK